MKQVTSPNDVPTGYHYVVMEFDTVSEYEPPWHKRDKEGTYYNKTVCLYYVTTDQKEWEKKIISLDERNKLYTAFSVDGLAKLEKKVSINIKPVTRG